MKFLIRCLIVLAVAIVSGLILYFTVQSLPGISTSSKPPYIRIEPQSVTNATENPAPQSERPGKDRDDGIRWRSILGVARQALMFSVLVFISVIAERIIFRRKPAQNEKSD